MEQLSQLLNDLLKNKNILEQDTILLAVKDAFNISRD